MVLESLCLLLTTLMAVLTMLIKYSSWVLERKQSGVSYLKP